MFLNATVGELLTGLTSPMLDSLSTLTSMLGGGEGLNKPENKKGRFGIISTKNDSAQGPFEVFMGIDKTQPKVFTVRSWDGKL